MKSSTYLFFLIVLIASAVLVFSKCGNANTHPVVKTPVDSSSPMGPAPDNNSANNPSLADTNYEKDRRPAGSDSVRKK